MFSTAIAVVETKYGPLFGRAISRASAAFNKPFFAGNVRVVIPLNTAAAPSSARTMWLLVSAINSSPGATNIRIANWLAKEPVGVKTPASLPNIAATRSSSELTVGSSL